MRIIVAEYPKSGGTWIVSLLGDALRLSKRDLYVNAQHPWLTDDSKGVNFRMHPWYINSTSLELTESCVIKSHELPHSAMHNFPAQCVQLVRDGRDVIVSKYFYERDFCVANGLSQQFDTSFDDYVTQVAVEWRRYVLAWLELGIPTFHYEDFLLDAPRTLQQMLEAMQLVVNAADVQQAIAANTKLKLKQALDKAHRHNTFIRKGIAGDWQNHFTAPQVRIFKELAGDVLIQLGYEQNSDW